MLTYASLSRAIIFCSLTATAVMLAACGAPETGTEQAVSPELDLRQKIAQKLMLDIRYYCPQMQRPAEGKAGNSHCDQAVTALPQDLRRMIADNDIGGIILFADNLADSAQMVRLNRQLQGAAASAASGLPLLIGIDQEGGRVNRLPRNEAAAFAGNMAIGATYPRHGEHFAATTATAMAEQLQALGFNVNFAPTLDVNSNPQNPVINVRSYGESAPMVADLGTAAVAAFQQQGIAATVKHFPGHGDTSVDSHTGLPRVERTLEDAHAIDLLPFKQVIANAQPALTMTAHIQYPALDDTVLKSKNGDEILVPATLSRKILHGILRNEMGYQGVIVTDSLNMAGISDYFSPEDAVVKTFQAGADIALMPIKVRYPEDIPRISALIEVVAEAVEAGELSQQELDESFARILTLKQMFAPATKTEQDIETAVEAARVALSAPQHRALASELASAALSSVFPLSASTLPVIDEHVSHIQVLAPNRMIGEAFRIALKDVTEANVSVLEPESAVADIAAAAADVLLVASIVPAESAVELGGMEDLQTLQRRQLDIPSLYAIYRQSLLSARAQDAKTVFISMRSPYESAVFESLADVHLASFDYKAFVGPDQNLEGPVYHAIARALVNSGEPTGRVPVTVMSATELQAQTTDMDGVDMSSEG